MATLNVFASQMQTLAQNINQNIPRMMREVAEAVVDVVANSTPVLTGQAAGNWKTTIGSPSSAWDMGASSAAKSTQEVRQALRGLREGQVVYISNNVPYIVRLNEGYSAKAPAAFVETAALIGVHAAGNFNLLIRP